MSFRVGDKVKLPHPYLGTGTVDEYFPEHGAVVAYSELLRRNLTLPEDEVEIAPDDMVNHPAHYTGHPTIEAIEVLEYVQDYRLGTAMKYLWRIAFGGKHDSVEDAKKAVWYINRWLEKQSDV